MPNNGEIRVEFPDKVKVTSPEIDSIKATSEHISNWLHHDFLEVIKPLQVLNELEDMLTHFKKEMVEQFGILFTSQIESQVVSRQASIRANEQKVKLIEDQISKKEIQFREAKERIVARYEKIAEQLVGEHAKYLKQLDSQAYEIVDKIYPDQIQEGFSFASLPAQKYLAAHVIESALTRSAALNDSYKKAKEIMTEFLKKRESFSEDIEFGVTDKLDAGDYYLPLWHIEVEDRETGDKHTELYFEWEISGNSAPISSAQSEILRAIGIDLIKNASFGELAEADKVELVNLLKKSHDTPENEVKRLLKDKHRISMTE